MDLRDLELFFKRTTIPTVNKRPLTFLGISKQPHYENVWSNIYKFFFNASAEHGLEDLFVKSLIQLIKEKRSEPFDIIAPFEVETEYRTRGDGRIDLLLYNASDAIIIENKVYHHLNNDLDDYWNSIHQGNKQGIVLSLKKITKINHSGFINMTHLELLERVFRNLSPYYLKANEKHLFFLKDFYQNIINETNPMDENLIKFFLNHAETIDRTKKVRDSFVNYIISEVEKTREYIDEALEPYNNRNEEFRYFLCPNQRNLMITIVFKDLIEGKNNLYIIVELQNDLLTRKEELRSIDFNSAENDILCGSFYTSKENYAHFANLHRELKEENILNLSKYLTDVINNSPILGIYRKVKQTLVDSK